MNIELLTKRDLNELRQFLISDLKLLLKTNNQTEWIRSVEAQELLNCSSSTLQNLRVNNILPYTKLGGTLYYDKGEIEEILKRNKNGT